MGINQNKGFFLVGKIKNVYVFHYVCFVERMKRWKDIKLIIIMLLLGKQKNGGNFDILLLSSFLFILEKKKKKLWAWRKNSFIPIFLP